MPQCARDVQARQFRAQGPKMTRCCFFGWGSWVTSARDLKWPLNLARRSMSHPSLTIPGTLCTHTHSLIHENGRFAHTDMHKKKTKQTKEPHCQQSAAGQNKMELTKRAAGTAAVSFSATWWKEGVWKKVMAMRRWGCGGGHRWEGRMFGMSLVISPTALIQTRSLK